MCFVVSTNINVLWSISNQKRYTNTWRDSHKKWVQKDCSGIPLCMYTTMLWVNSEKERSNQPTRNSVRELISNIPNLHFTHKAKMFTLYSFFKLWWNGPTMLWMRTTLESIVFLDFFGFDLSSTFWCVPYYYLFLGQTGLHYYYLVCYVSSISIILLPFQ